MGVFATTGMGKSNFMKVFAASCMRLAAGGESKFGLLIVDPHGEYLKGKDLKKGLVHLKRYREGLACYSTDQRNASDPDVEELAIAESEFGPEDMALLYDWSPPQRDALGCHIQDSELGLGWRRFSVQRAWPGWCRMALRIPPSGSYPEDQERAGEK